MEICGIIAEYNPLHDGHAHQIQETKKILGDVYMLAVMSGNFVQRGEPAIFNKYIRAKSACNYLDCVVELPAAFSLSPAEDFAFFGIKILNEIGTKYISFGSECGDLEKLEKISKIIFSEDKQFKSLLKQNLNSGLGYAISKTNTLIEIFQRDSKILEILNKPNNLLGVEYLTAIKRQNSKIIPITIKRVHNYNKEDVGKLMSATTIRKVLKSGKIVDLKEHLSSPVFENIKDNFEKFNLPDEKTLGGLINYKINTSNLKSINGIVEGLENRFKSLADSNLESMLESVKTKRYTYSKLKRVSMNILLDIDKKTVAKAKKVKPYIKILAVKNKEILSYLNKKNCLVLTDLKSFKGVKNKALKKLIELDNLSDKIYEILINKKIEVLNIDIKK